MALDNIIDQMNELQAAAAGMHKNLRGVDASIREATRSLFSFANLFKGAVALSVQEYARERLQGIIQHHRERSKVMATELEQKKKSLGFTTDLLKAIRAGVVTDARSLAIKLKRLEMVDKEAAQLRSNVKALKEENGWRGVLNDALDKFSLAQRINVGLVATAFHSLIDTAHEYNRALMQANTSIDERYSLIRKTLVVQSELGIATRSMAESAEALVEYGQDLTPAFQQNLKVVSMMKEGLGVSARTGAQLVTIFTRQLSEGAERVGDVIATIAQQTGLAAERAAEFAVEIGRALRLLGSGFKTEASAVTQVITNLAGRVQEMGGNANSIVQAFKSMSGGTSQAFFMRGLAGVRPGQLGTGAGAEAAMRGLNQRMGAIINSPEGTEAFLAQVEAVSEITGMAAEDVINFRKAMEDLKKPLSESQALQKAYDRQTALLGTAFNQLREAAHAVLMRGLMPLMPYVTSAVQWISRVGRALASWEPMVPVIAVGLVAASALAISSLGKLGWQILKFAMESKVAGSLIKSGGMPDFRSLTSIAKFIPGLGRLAPYLGPGAQILGAGMVGYGLGTILDRKFPDNLLSQWFKKWAQNAYEDRNARNQMRVSLSGPGHRSAAHDAVEAGRRIARDILAGQDPGDSFGMGQANRYERHYMGQMPSLNGGVLRRRALDEASDELHREIAQAIVSRGTVKTEADKRQDAQFQIALQSLQILKDQLDAQLKIKGATRSQEQISKDEAAEREYHRQDQLWNFQSPALPSQKNSYRN